MPSMITLVDNTVPVANDFNSNFSALNQAIGTGTTITSYSVGDLLYGSATNTLSKLVIGSAYQTLQVAPSTLIPSWASNPVTLDRDVTSQTVASTATETTVYTFDVPANVMSTNRMVRFTGWLRYTNNNAATADLTLKLKFGGSLFLNVVVTNIPTSASVRTVQIEGWVSNLNATGSQLSGGRCFVSGAGTALIASDIPSGAGSIANAIQVSSQVTSIDTTAAATFLVTVQHDASSANQSITFDFGQLELI